MNGLTIASLHRHGNPLEAVECTSNMTSSDKGYISYAPMDQSHDRMSTVIKEFNGNKNMCIYRCIFHASFPLTRLHLTHPRP